MLNRNRIMRTYGSQFIAKGLDEAFLYLDPYVPLGEGGAPHNRISTFLNLAGGVLLPVAGNAAKVGDSTQQALETMGGYMLTNIWDYASEYMAQPVQSAARNRAVSRISPSPSVQVSQRTSQKFSGIPVRQNGTYRPG
jgi:hypothetical protein